MDFGSLEAARIARRAAVASLVVPLDIADDQSAIRLDGESIGRSL